FQILEETWLAARQISETAAIQRQFPHRSLIHQSRDRRIGRLNQRRFARHSDSLGDSADLKSEIHHGLPTHGQGDAAPDHRLETDRLARDLVASQSQLRSPETPALIGAHCPANSLIYILQAYREIGRAHV